MVAYANAGNQYNQYRQQSAMTASPGELTLMLYDGCIKDMKLFCMAVEENDFVKANETSQKAQAIVSELMRSLDMKYDLSKQLMSLYDFILHTMVQSNIKKDVSLAHVAMDMVTELRDAWQQAVRINRQQVFGKGTII